MRNLFILLLQLFSSIAVLWFLCTNNNYRILVIVFICSAITAVLTNND